MPNSLLSVSRLSQRGEGDCLPTCAQMVLTWLGRGKSWEFLCELFGTRSFGTPAANILRLRQIGVRVTLDEIPRSSITNYLARNQPVIAFINTADLPYWTVDTDHAVVVIGMDKTNVYLNAPYYADQTQQVTHAAFELSQLRFNHLCAVLELE
ncbi:hypothetical protein FBQ82_03560 [Anaerolineae bacterium CFX7]|nr:hypothetical protein [Anaerolineae bacterium CFX7]